MNILIGQKHQKATSMTMKMMPILLLSSSTFRLLLLLLQQQLLLLLLLLLLLSSPPLPLLLSSTVSTSTSFSIVSHTSFPICFLRSSLSFCPASWYPKKTILWKVLLSLSRLRSTLVKILPPLVLFCCSVSLVITGFFFLVFVLTSLLKKYQG